MSFRQLLVFALIAAGMWNVILLARLRAYRIDLRGDQGLGEGRSGIWQVNVLDPRNYNPQGRRLLRWFIIGWVSLAGAGALLLFGAAG